MESTKGLSRRGFLKGAAIAAGTTVATGVFTGSALASEGSASASGSAASGSASAVASGSASASVASASMSASASGSASASTSASAGMVTSGTAANTLVSWSWETKPAPIAEADIVDTIETEVLVLGAGNAGCSAACSAAEAGAKVIVAEKTDAVNGRGGGVGACNSRLNESVGFVIDTVPAEYRWNRTCGNRNNEALVKLWFDNSGLAMNWLLDKADAHGATYNLYAGYSKSEIAPEEPDFHMFQAGDFEMPPETGYFVPTALLYSDSLTAGVQYLFSSPAVQLLQDDSGKVTGAILSTADGYKQVNASKAVILATGDIQADTEMMNCYCERRMKDVLRSDYYPAGVDTGDGHKMGMWAGAVMQESPFPAALHPQAGTMFHGPFMWVNVNGERFFNEANWVQCKSLQMMRQPEHYAYSIFDSNYGEDTKDSLNYGGGMFWDTMSRNVLDEFNPADIEATVDGEVEKGETAWKADTLEELADKIGVPKDAFLAQIERYNADCEAGVDSQYAKEAHFLYPIKDAPFYATKAAPAMLVIVGGLKVNTDLQCIDADGNPIEGLYAIGNTSGDLYAVDYPINMPGNSNGRCLTWGWLVGQTVAAL